MQAVFRNNATTIFNALESQQIGKFTLIFDNKTLNGVNIRIRNAQELQSFCAESNPNCIQSNLFDFITTN